MENIKFPRVSILLPVFNGAITLKSAIQSVIDQEYLDWELIILDDGSTDDSLKILGTFHDSRIKIISDGLRKGLATRLNIGIDLALGIYIARMDADDLCFPKRLEMQISFLDSHPEVDLTACKTLAFSSHEANDTLRLLPYYQTHDELSARPWKSIYMPHPAWVGKREWFRRFRYQIPEVLRAEDQELLLRAMPSSRYYCLPEILMAYRQNLFNLKKSLLARKGLYKSQMRIFLERREWIYMIQSTWNMVQKLIFDFLRALSFPVDVLKTGYDKKIPSEVIDQFIGMIQKYEESNNVSIIKSSKGSKKV
jgi:glycosyltransferase involved in cell wall biosynthesis